MPKTPFNEAERIRVGQMIFDERHAQHLTREEVCDRINATGAHMKPKTLADIEFGIFSARLDELSNIAQALGKKVGFLPN